MATPMVHPQEATQQSSSTSNGDRMFANDWGLSSVRNRKLVKSAVRGESDRPRRVGIERVGRRHVSSRFEPVRLRSPAMQHDSGTVTYEILSVRL